MHGQHCEDPLFLLLQHPNVHGIVDVFYIAEASIVVLIQQVVKEGSLKDVIWKPIEPLSDKSGVSSVLILLYRKCTESVRAISIVVSA